MPSEKKKRKLKNSYCSKGTLKNKNTRLKRVLFFTPSLRKKLKNNLNPSRYKLESWQQLYHQMYI